MNEHEAKSISGAFPTLKLPPSIKALDLKCCVDRVSVARASRCVNIYLSSNELIHKSEIVILQKEIKKQLFHNLPNHVECIESFHIKKDIQLSALFQLYKDSIYFELKESGALLYHLLKSAKITFFDSLNPPKMTVSVRFFVPDDEKLLQLQKLLYDIISVRFNKTIQIDVIRQPQSKSPTASEISEIPAIRFEESVDFNADDPYMEITNLTSHDNEAYSGYEDFSPPAPKPKDSAQKAQKGFSKYRKKKDADVIFGRDVEGSVTKISQITDEIGEVVIAGKLLRKDARLLKNENSLFLFDVTDFTDTIGVKLFAKPEQTEKLNENLEVGKFYKFKGVAKYDTYDKDINIGSVTGIKAVAPSEDEEKRADTAAMKRAELHCHTKMSNMDGVSEAADIIKAAYAFGHPGIAITDHGSVYAFPDAFAAWKKIIKTQKEKALKENREDAPFKLVYGVEGYLVDDSAYFDNVETAAAHSPNQGSAGNKPKGLGLEGINRSADYVNFVRKAKTNHIIILAANETGRVNLYRLMSASHLYYYTKRPRIPKSLLETYREGLILGSACEAGEVFRAITARADADVIKKTAEFYDYLEIQPLGNNEFMLFDDKKYPHIKTREDLKNLNKAVAELAVSVGKPLVATCDVHFLNPADEVYRRILMAGKGFSDADRQAPLYLHTTDEMLEEFSYLGEELAYEAVVENPRKILDLCEQIEPVRPDKCSPVIENSDEMLRTVCYENAHKKYGENLPEIVEKRLKRELGSIIDNGYAVMYMIARKLVKKSNDDGYLVGSRGSVGSSLAATMAGITEVNPLPPHYYCPHCRYTDFDSAKVKEYHDKTGFDLPDSVCPVCGKGLHKDGFDIPFETFLGFYGDKEPDIDLNFSGEYQTKAHSYTEELFGAGFTYRAGTIGTLKDKTAYGFVKKYLTERNQHKRSAEINRIVAGCTGVLRTTGQHPGGIVVLPNHEEINTFTPVAHPANDIHSDIITTQFDYHSIDQNLLKLDILGHDDPTMIRMLQDLTGIDPATIPMDDPKVMSLFSSTKALGIKPADIDGCERGTLGVPEFGTGFVIKMLIDAKPETFSDLVRISGLSHGTDVWVGNAATLIEEKKATISTAICTRDDIMTYLISMGVESGLAFKIMESVRKGKGLNEEMEAAMQAADVPDWYIWSCKKIKYMFPKAHAAAYVMMAWRIAWFKVYYPIAYYTAYFSIRSKGFSYAMMCMGEAVFLRAYADIAKRAKATDFDDENSEYSENSENPEEFGAKDAEHADAKKSNGTNKVNEVNEKADPGAKLSEHEKNIYKDMKIVMEMFARGIEFAKLDFMTADATKFKISDGKIMPALTALEGTAQKAARFIEEAVKDGPFLSKQDFKIRAKANKNLMELIDTYDLLPGIGESNQMSFF